MGSEIVEIIDMEGNILLQSRLSIEKGYRKIAINIAELGTGVYIVRIIAIREEIAQTKLIVSK